MESDKAKEVLGKFGKLTEEDKAFLLTGLENHFGKQVRISIDDLLEMDPKDIETIDSIIGGIILTREHVRDIQTVHERLVIEDLPSRISFGTLRHSEIDED